MIYDIWDIFNSTIVNFCFLAMLTMVIDWNLNFFHKSSLIGWRDVANIKPQKINYQWILNSNKMVSRFTVLTSFWRLIVWVPLWTLQYKGWLHNWLNYVRSRKSVAVFVQAPFVASTVIYVRYCHRVHTKCNHMWKRPSKSWKN